MQTAMIYPKKPLNVIHSLYNMKCIEAKQGETDPESTHRCYAKEAHFA